MPSLIDIRRRVRAVKSTQQITKAMKMVSASKLRRAQQRIIGARPYAQQALRVMSSIAKRVDPAAHPLLRESEVPGAPPLLIVVSADRGLCGSFNSNILKQASAFQRESTDRAVAMALVGRKARDFFMRRGVDVRYEAVNVFQQVKYSHAQDIARAATPDVRGVVSFHGIFAAPNLGAQPPITAKVLILHGWEDPLAPPESVLAIAKELTDAGADWQLHAYGHAMHAFTFEGADFPERGIRYHPEADRRSWDAMRYFLEEVFADRR